jgi:hypothetical protein
MPKTVPSADEIQADYVQGVQAKGDKWRRRFLAKTGIADAAKSDLAEAHYASAISTAVQNKQRQKGLAGVTDADIKDAVSRGTGAMYSGPAASKAPKFAKKLAPYLPVLQAAVSALPPRTSDAATNVTNRVVPIAVALQSKKRTG